MIGKIQDDGFVRSGRVTEAVCETRTEAGRAPAFKGDTDGSPPYARGEDPLLTRARIFLERPREWPERAHVSQLFTGTFDVTFILDRGRQRSLHAYR